MPIAVECPACGARFRTKDEFAGKRAKCPKCAEVLTIPAAADVEEAAVEEIAAEPSGSRTPASAPRRGGGSGARRGGSSSGRRKRVAETGLPPVALAAGVAIAVVGAVAWAFLYAKAQIEIGWLAIGIGAGVGMGMRGLGAAGTPAGVLGAALALLSIFGGRYAGVSMMVDEVLAADSEELLEYTAYVEEKNEYREDARLYELHGGDAMSDAEIAQFLIDRDYVEASGASGVSDEDVAWFREEQVPILLDLEGLFPSYEDWRAEREALIEMWIEQDPDAQSNLSLTVEESLDVKSIGFLIFGLVAAYGLLSKPNYREA